MQSDYPPYSPQNTDFANFGPIWMKLAVEVKNGEQSSNLEFEAVGVVHHPLTHPTTQAKTTPNAN